MVAHAGEPSLLEAALGVVANLAGETANGALLMGTTELIIGAMARHADVEGVQVQVRCWEEHSFGSGLKSLDQRAGIRPCL